MNIEDSKKIYDAAISIDNALGTIDSIISLISDKNEKVLWVNRLSIVIRSINEQLLIPIEKDFPELRS